MSQKHEVTGLLSTVVAVTYTNCQVSQGKWLTKPGGSAPVGSSQLFVAGNRDSNAAAAFGWASYISADGTVFTFNFEDPQNDDNNCWSSMNPVNGPYQLPPPQYPNSGKTWTVTYSIAQSSKQPFFDAPVFPEHLLNASKCDLFPEKKILKLIGDKKCLYLKDAFEENELDPVYKIWCATHKLFLTPSSKALLSRDLVQLAIRELSPESGRFNNLINDVLQANRDFAQGTVGITSLERLKDVLTETENALKPASINDARIFCLVGELANTDQHAGWSNAVSVYLQSPNKVTMNKRIEAVRELIEKRF
jgi:hypothetical protein